MQAKPSSVLIIESDPVERDLIRLAMTRLGISATCVASGEAALESIHARHPDLILLDLFLPQQNGLDFLQQLKQTGLLVSIPVIVVSSLGFPEIVQQAVQAGARDFLVKPIDTDLLVLRVQKLFGG